MSRRIEKRTTFAGARSDPEALESLEERRAQHRRLIQGKPEKSFSDFLHEKMHPEEKNAKPEQEEATPKGAKDPLLGLSPGQSPALAESGKGRRAGRVIVKG